MANLLEWRKTLVEPILVVGNAVLTQKVPEDSYPTVVRFNNFVLGGLSGEKVTHWVANGYPEIEDCGLRPVVIPWSQQMEQRRRVPSQPFRQKIGSNGLLYLPDDYHIIRHFPFSAFQGRCFPSTGFCFLAWLHRIGCVPDLVGFDGMKTGHQGNPDWKHGHVKTKNLEWSIIRSWKWNHR